MKSDCVVFSPVQLCLCASVFENAIRNLQSCVTISILTPRRLFHLTRLQTLSDIIDNDTEIVGCRWMTAFLKHRSRKSKQLINHCSVESAWRGELVESLQEPAIQYQFTQGKYSPKSMRFLKKWELSLGSASWVKHYPLMIDTQGENYLESWKVVSQKEKQHSYYLEINKM